MAKKKARKAPKGTSRKAAPAAAPSRPNWLFRGGLIAIVVVGGGWLLLGGGQGAAGPPPTPTELAEVLAEAEADPGVGMALAESAPITIEEFYDPSCPACAQFSGFAGKLIRQNYVERTDAPVRWVAYSLILGSFPNSVSAALAERCADEQGLYWPMHDLLLARQTRWYLEQDPIGAITEIAGDAGVDPGTFAECMRERRHLDAVAASHKVAESRGVNSTPTIFVDGERVNWAGMDPYTYLEGLIQNRLAALSSGDDGSESGEGTP